MTGVIVHHSIITPSTTQQQDNTMAEQMNIPTWFYQLCGTFGDIVEAVKSDFDITGNLSEIEYKSRDGFFPFTNGGIEFMASMRLEDVASSGAYPNNEAVTKELDRAINYGYEQARKSFIENNRIRLDGLYTKEQLDNNSDEINYHDLYEKKYNELAESLSEYEMEYNSEVFFIQHRAIFFSADNHRNITGQDEIYFYSGVNTDYDYGRDKGLMDCYENTIAVGDLTPNKVDSIVKAMLQSI